MVQAVAVFYAAAASTGDPLLNWLVNNATAVGMLAFVVVALLRGWLVTGREADEVRRQRDRAMELVYRQADLTRDAVAISSALAERK